MRLICTGDPLGEGMCEEAGLRGRGGVRGFELELPERRVVHVRRLAGQQRASSERWRGRGGLSVRPRSGGERRDSVLRRCRGGDAPITVRRCHRARRRSRGAPPPPVPRTARGHRNRSLESRLRAPGVGDDVGPESRASWQPPSTTGPLFVCRSPRCTRARPPASVSSWVSLSRRGGMAATEDRTPPSTTSTATSATLPDRRMSASAPRGRCPAARRRRRGGPEPSSAAASPASAGSVRASQPAGRLAVARNRAEAPARRAPVEPGEAQRRRAARARPPPRARRS